MNINKVALYLENIDDPFKAKLAHTFIRYKRESVSYLISSKNTVFQGIEVKKSIIEDLNIESMIIGIVLPTGIPSKKLIEEIRIAIENEIDVINPLHIDFSKIEEIQKIGIKENTKTQIFFNNKKASIYNIREVPENIPLFSLKTLNTKAKRILAVGSDCNIGKMLTSIELDKAFKKENYNSSFIATGQSGMLIKGEGMAIDRVISDFLPGAVEQLILKEQDKEILFIEGQGSIFQPIYSAVTLGLIHGAAPDAMIFCHLPSRKKIRYTEIDMPETPKMIKLYEDLANIIHPSKIIGISLNCFDMTNEEAEIEIKKIEKLTGLPATDPIKFGVKKLVNEIKKIL